MKNVKTVLSHIFPKNSKFSEHQCFNKLISILPKRFKEHTLFCYKKDKTLFFVLDHPAIKMEFNYNLKLINELLNIVKNSFESCKNLKIDNIKLFVKNQNFKKFKAKKREINRYKELSKGEFKNFAKKEEIRDLIEEIRKNIREINE